MYKRIILYILIIITNIISLYIIYNKDIIDSNSNLNNDYLGIIKIPSLGIERPFYNLFDDRNTVDKNVMLINGSDMPDINNGNLILAAHRGSSSVAFFNNLHLISNNDLIIVIYNNKKYVYEYNNRYDVEKTGIVKITRDMSQNTITLITCKKNTNKQTVFIGYLKYVINL
jgi:LPXTG-site transpeptidase (sortase) family protein